MASPQALPTIHGDSDGKTASRAVSALRLVGATPENELKRWRRTFDANAKVVNGEKSVHTPLVTCLNTVHMPSSSTSMAVVSLLDILGMMHDGVGQ